MSNLKKDIHTLARKKGEKLIASELIAEGMSSRLADQLCAGTYKNEPKAHRKTIETVLKKNGFATEGKAS